MTDITGFGLLGHLLEICEGSGCSATIEFDKIPVIGSLPHYLRQNCLPGGTQRNWDSYGHKISPLSDEQRAVLADPQTSGGLLVAVTEKGAPAFEELLLQHGLPASHCISFGTLDARNGAPSITVK